jgi:high-affinity nickel permease
MNNERLSDNFFNRIRSRRKSTTGCRAIEGHLYSIGHISVAFLSILVIFFGCKTGKNVRWNLKRYSYATLPILINFLFTASQPNVCVALPVRKMISRIVV